MAALSRREFLAGAAAAVAGAALAATADAAGEGEGAPARTLASPGRIDTHHHLLPPGYLERARDFLAKAIPGMAPVYSQPWSPAKSLDEMDRHGIATAVLSVSAPGIDFAGPQLAMKLARLCNDYAAGMRRDHRGRFGSFAVLPLPDVDASLREIEYAFDTLHADGVGLVTSYGGRWPGHPDFAPVFEELNRRKAIVYFHPTGPACCVNTITEIQPAFLEFPYDSTRAIASLLYSGAFTRWPSIRWMFSHGGGALVAVHSRLVAESLRVPGDPRFPNGAYAELRKLYYDTASVTNGPTFGALTALVPTSQLLLGTDYPLGPPYAATIREFESLALEPDVRRAIEHDNALRLMPQLTPSA
jgi:predicted TIM-barrel fold metal-dependent hydrolase